MRHVISHDSRRTPFPCSRLTHISVVALSVACACSHPSSGCLFGSCDPNRACGTAPDFRPYAWGEFTLGDVPILVPTADSIRKVWVTPHPRVAAQLSSERTDTMPCDPTARLHRAGARLFADGPVRAHRPGFGRQGPARNRDVNARSACSARPWSATNSLRSRPRMRRSCAWRHSQRLPRR